MATDEKDRPRKKKKKKTNTGLWIGLGVGGGLFLTIVVVLVVVLAISAMGNREQDAQAKARLQAALLAAQKPPAPAPVQPPQPKFDKDIGEKKRDSTNLRLRAERTGRLHELGQIKLFYMQYGDGSKPPPTVDEFVKSMGREGQAIKQAIDEKYYIILPSVHARLHRYHGRSA